MSHANARLTPAGRLILVQRIATGRPAAHVAAEMGVSRACAYKWWGWLRAWLGRSTRPALPSARHLPHHL